MRKTSWQRVLSARVHKRFETATTWATSGGPRAREIREKDLKKGWEEIDGVLHCEGLLYLPEIIWTEIISTHHDDLLAGYFGVEKTRELVAQKYYWLTLRADIEAYVKGCDICIISKVVRHKLYEDLQSLLVPIHYCLDLFMDFVTDLPVSRNWKGEIYDSILIIVDQHTKMVHYELVKLNIDALDIAKGIIDVVVWSHDLPVSIISDQSSVFTSKF